MRAKKRFKRMEFNPGEPELYEHAQDTRFSALVDDIAADPSGRGRVPAASPLAMKPAPAEYPDMAFTAEEVYNPEKGDTQPLPELAFPEPKQAAPAALLSGGKGYSMPKPEDEVPAWEKGDNEAIPGLEFPPDASAATMAPMEAPANAAPQKPDYGRVQAEQVKPGSAGPAPGGGDKTLALLRGAGSILMSAGGRADMGMKAGLDAYSHYQDQERELRDHGARQAELDAQAAKEQRGENRYASETNYGRMRDEGQDFRDTERDQFQRGYMERGEARAADAQAYERDPARRQEELDQYRGKKQIDREFAPKRGAGGGNMAGRIAQFDAARQRLEALRGGPDKLTPEDKAQLQYAANDLKDPGGTLNKYADRIEGFGRQDSQIAARAAQVDAKAQAKAEGAKKQAQSTVAELDRVIALIDKEMKGGATYVPGMEPLVTGLGERVARGAAMTGLPQLVGSDRGSTGYTPDQTVIQAVPRLLAQAAFHEATGQTANMAAERERAEAAFMNAGTLEALKRELENRKASLTGALQNGTYIPRDQDGNALVMQQGESYTNPEEM